MSVQLLSSVGSAAEPVPLARADAILCDMDGTLVDSSAVVESMWSSFARDHGMSERFDEIMAYSPGRTGIDTIRRFLPDLTAEEHDAIHERFAREEIVRTAGRMEEAGGPIPSIVVSADDVERGKPDPDAYLKAAELLGVPIASCLVLEDAASGYTAARRASAQVLLVGNGVPEADPGTLRIPDFTGVTFTIH